MPPDLQRILDSLREQIRRLERRPARRSGVLGSGLPEVDALLPGGGFPRGALADVAGGPASGKTMLVLSAIAEAQREEGLAAFVDGRGELYPPAAQPLGVDLERLLLVRPAGGCGRGDLELFWAAEALLASGAFDAVAVDVPVRSAGRAEAMLRRLQSAAERGGAVGLWLAAPGICRVPAAVHLEVAPGRGGAPRVCRVRARGPGAGVAWAPPRGGHAA